MGIAGLGADYLNKKKPIEPWMQSRMKSKCLVSIIALLEGLEVTGNLMSRIMRTIQLKVLKKNLTAVYGQFKQLYKGDYITDVFGHAEADVDPDDLEEDPEYYEFVIENGFNIYILMNQFMDYC